MSHLEMNIPQYLILQIDQFLISINYYVLKKKLPLESWETHLLALR